MLEVVNPATEEVVGEVPSGDAADVERERTVDAQGCQPASRLAGIDASLQWFTAAKGDDPQPVGVDAVELDEIESRGPGHGEEQAATPGGPTSR